VLNIKKTLLTKSLFCSEQDRVRTYTDIDFGRMRMETLTPTFSFFLCLCKAKTLRGYRGLSKCSSIVSIPTDNCRNFSFIFMIPMV